MKLLMYKLYLIHLAAKLCVNIEAACGAKMEKNAEKYPAKQIWESARNYTSNQHEDL